MEGANSRRAGGQKDEEKKDKVSSGLNSPFLPAEKLCQWMVEHQFKNSRIGSELISSENVCESGQFISWFTSEHL